MTRHHVAICIATFRRPQGLRRLLDSLNILSFAGQPPRITVVVVDNDASGSVAQDDLRLAHPLIYRREAKRGLASVRNACLAAVPEDADFVAFVDDDEWVAPEWLDALLAMHVHTNADIVQGPVRPVYPVAPPAWMSRGGYHEVGPFQDGAELTHGASGNVLIKRAAIIDSGARFHNDFNATGGEDVDFFHFLRSQGCSIVAAADAIALEDVPRDRMTLSWILRRRFRTGHTLGKVAMRHGGVIARLGKAVGRLGLGSVEAVAGLLISRTCIVRGLTNIAWGLGTLSAFTPLPPICDRDQVSLSKDDDKQFRASSEPLVR